MKSLLSKDEKGRELDKFEELGQVTEEEQTLLKIPHLRNESLEKREERILGILSDSTERLGRVLKVFDRIH